MTQTHYVAGVGLYEASWGSGPALNFTGGDCLGWIDVCMHGGLINYSDNGSR